MKGSDGVIMSRLLDHLPAVFQEEASPPDAPTFLEQFLLPFEEILFGVGDPRQPGLETTIATLADHLAPERMREEFLAWFSQWMGLTLARNLSVPKRREFLGNIMRHFSRRGTKANLETLLFFFTDATAVVIERDLPELQIGIHSCIGIDTCVEGNPPHAFEVILTLPSAHTDQARPSEARLRALATQVIEWDKPAHTAYALHLVVNTHDEPTTDTREKGIT